MSRDPQYKPTGCKGCGASIIFERQPDGKWLVSDFDTDDWLKLERHNCSNPTWKTNTTNKTKPFEKIGGVVTDAWTGTNKQGQIFQARESKKQDDEVTEALAADIEFLTKSIAKVMRVQEEQNTLLQTWNESFKELYNMLNVMFIAGKYNEPISAAADIAYKEIKEPEFNVKTSEEDDFKAEGEDDDTSKDERERSDYGF